MITPELITCPVCCLEYPYLHTYSLAACSHKYCQPCCLQHINARIAAFQAPNCLDDRCSKQFDKNSYVYHNLPPQVKMNLAKHQQFVRIQNNKNLKPCNSGSCLGVINANQHRENKSPVLYCPQCNSKHCRKCYGLAHENPQLCQKNHKNNQNNQDEAMRNLNYRRCPNCSVWVERNGGCQYLKCKCRTQFCFACGEKFQYDSCRKQNSITSEKKIREINKGLWNSIHSPNSVKQILLFFPKTLLKLILILLFTVLSGLLFMALVFGILIPLFYLVSPAALIVLYGEMEIGDTLTLVARIFTVVLYPVVGLVVAVVMLFVFATYPFMRILYATHFYDEIDRFVSSISIVYLQGVNCVLKI